jgi:hypothetical protein
MRFTRIALATSLILLVGSLVGPATQRVNHNNPGNGNQRMQLADGTPLPPLPPPNASNASLVADGTPLPPLPPPNANELTLLADGTPLPPLPPPNSIEITQQA